MRTSTQSQIATTEPRNHDRFQKRTRTQRAGTPTVRPSNPGPAHASRRTQHATGSPERRYRPLHPLPVAPKRPLLSRTQPALHGDRRIHPLGVPGPNTQELQGTGRLMEDPDPGVRFRASRFIASMDVRVCEVDDLLRAPQSTEKNQLFRTNRHRREPTTSANSLGPSGASAPRPSEKKPRGANRHGFAPLHFPALDRKAQVPQHG